MYLCTHMHVCVFTYIHIQYIHIYIRSNMGGGFTSTCLAQKCVKMQDKVSTKVKTYRLRVNTRGARFRQDVQWLCFIKWWRFAWDHIVVVPKLSGLLFLLALLGSALLLWRPFVTESHWRPECTESHHGVHSTIYHYHHHCYFKKNNRHMAILWCHLCTFACYDSGSRLP